MSENIQEIRLDIAEEVQDIVENIAEIKAGEEPVLLDPGEEVKPVTQNTQSIKPKAKVAVLRNYLICYRIGQSCGVISITDFNIKNI